MAIDTRPSITKTIEERYATQREGGAFDIKTTLGNPGSHPRGRQPINGIQEKKWTVPNFQAFAVPQKSEFYEVGDGINSLQRSVYMRGFDNRPYRR